MKLSVVIVNYNVKHFLEQALYSVRKAMHGIDGEVWVVDNNSADGSCDMVKRKFPEVKLIENKKNTGFSMANNQAIREAKGEYVLLLNPDTVVEEDCFKQCIAFMDQTPDAGATGVKMIDGKGQFLPESKRSLPTPKVAFYKMFGLSAIFPHSKKFGRYHLGFLSNDEVHKVEVLSGAFMFIRKSVLDTIGLLDEDYFMYGEDIDLSYRITKSGYHNYYFPHTTIIHYKGESTKKTSVNYVFVFYKAMIIFARKHYTQKHARLFSLLINFAIYIRAGISIGIRTAQSMLKPLIDFLVIYGGMFLLKTYWEQNIKYVSGGEYPLVYMTFNSLVYTLIWITSLYFAGAYEKPRSVPAIFKGILFGSLGIAVFYAFIPETYRFSRALIVLSALWAFMGTYLVRLLFYIAKFKRLNLGMFVDTKTIIVGNHAEVNRVYNLLVHSNAATEYAGYVNIDASEKTDDFYLGHVSQLPEIVPLFHAEEIIFCSKDISASQIIQWMGTIRSPEVQFKIVPEESVFIIGSNSKNAQGDFYSLELNLKLSTPLQLRKKRVFDVLMALLLLVLSPLLLLIVNRRLNYISNIVKVFFGERTWVGYAEAENSKILPVIKRGVLSPLNAVKHQTVNSFTTQKLNFLYAKDYSIEKDLYILMNGVRQLGN